MIKIFTMGRLTEDPRVRDTKNGKVASFNFAAYTKKKDAEGKRLANFFRVTVWGKQAEIAEQYLKKGSMISVTGDFAETEYQSQKTGKNGKVMEIDNAEFQMTPQSRDAQQTQQERPQRSQKQRERQDYYEEEDDNSDDLPF